MMIPIIVRPWESGSHLQTRNLPPPPINQSVRPLIRIRPFQEESPSAHFHHHQESPKIRIRPLSELADLEDQETPPLIRIRKFQEISEREEDEEKRTDLLRPARPRNPFPQIISQFDLPQDLSIKKVNVSGHVVESSPLKKLKTEEEIILGSYEEKGLGRRGHVSKELLRNKLLKTTVPIRSYQISIPDEGGNLNRVTTTKKTEKSSHIFQIPVLHRITTRDESKISPPIPTYPKKYSANIGAYYECPKCLQKYVSSIDVWEHLSRCEEEFNPILIPQVELIDLEDDEEEYVQEVSRSPDVIPTTVIQQSASKPQQPTSGGNSDEKFQCDFPGCKRTFTSTSGLSGHRRLHRASKNIFKCPKCALQYSWKAQLRSHLIKRHPTVPSSSSDMDKYAMNEKFPAASNNTTNNLNNPEPEKNVRKGNNKKGKTEAELVHFCSTCNLKFSSEYEFAAHGLQHRIDIEKNFTCRYCSKAFFRRIFLVEHEKSHL